MTIERSTDYAAIRKLLTDPRSYRRMTTEPLESFVLKPRSEVEIVAVKEAEELLAVFLIIQGIELHFCYSPAVWGRTLAIAKAFLEWAWANLTTNLLVGPIPERNRLALKLAKRAGFQEHPGQDGDGITYSPLQRPA